MKNVELNQVDDFVVAGGFQQVNLDNVKARGKTNFYLDSGNSRMFVGEQIYEYGVTDIEKRTQLANLDQRRKRWNSITMMRPISTGNTTNALTALQQNTITARRLPIRKSILPIVISA